MPSLGPLPWTVLEVGLAAAVALVLGHCLAGPEPGDRRRARDLILNLALLAVLAARLSFVAVHAGDYLVEPTALLRIGDGGFLPWVGIGVALLAGIWFTRGNGRLRQAAALAATAGLLAWLLAGLATARLQVSAALPDLLLTRVAGEPARLAALADGRPLVVNLWATWCPPCRRELPVLARAQGSHPDIAIVLVNQGESEQEVRAFLAGEPSAPDNALMLIDTGSSMMAALGARALPVTLFFDAEGRQVGSHVGELTRATLAVRLQRLREAARGPRPQR
ncbi:MAG: TlpA family protein disulfide reductase [Xanthomonadales bacterium]|nr:TlpA family protein disulfide reductase [Xanthomonadales bacterium]